MADPTILATSGGFQPTGRNVFQWRMGPLVRLALQLTGARLPRICWLGTAQGDSVNGIQAFYGACAGEPVQPSHLQLFTMPNFDDVAGHLLGQDVIWVGGGSVANLLALWRLHRLDELFAEAWQRGVVLGGVSAGSICWHVGGPTDSFGPDLRLVTNGLGLVPFSNAVHYDTEEQRRPVFHRAVVEGSLPHGYATEDGVGLLYHGEEMVEAVTDTPGKRAFFVERDSSGAAERELAVRLLG